MKEFLQLFFVPSFYLKSNGRDAGGTVLVSLIGSQFEMPSKEEISHGVIQESHVEMKESLHLYFMLSFSR